MSERLHGLIGDPVPAEFEETFHVRDRVLGWNRNPGESIKSRGPKSPSDKHTAKNLGKMLVTVSNIVNFVSHNQSAIEKNLLARCDPGRLVSLLAFEQFIGSHAVAPGRVAVVSGPETEPKLSLVPGNYVCDFLDRDARPEFYDLNLELDATRLEALAGLLRPRSLRTSA